MVEHAINVTPDGQIEFIHSDDLACLLDLGTPTIRRASNVEWGGQGWSADLAPVGGPVLGPYRRRKDALAAEVAWLRDHGY